MPITFDGILSCGITKRFPISIHQLFLRAKDLRKPLKPACTIPFVELNPPARIAVSKVPDSLHIGIAQCELLKPHSPLDTLYNYPKNADKV